MKPELAELVMNRVLDGVAASDEREELARAINADPMLKQEFEELQVVHTATESLFKQLTLPGDFSARVMRRLQDREVPVDQLAEAAPVLDLDKARAAAGSEAADSVRLPATRPQGRRASVVKAHRTRARIYAMIATVSAAAALMLSVGILTGFFARAGIGAPESTPVVADDNKSTDKNVADGRRGGPDKEDLNRTGSSTRQPHEITDTPVKPRDGRGDDGGLGPLKPDELPPLPKDDPRGSKPDVVEDDGVSPVAPDKGAVIEDEPRDTTRPEPKEPSDVVETPRERDTEATVVEREPVGELVEVSGSAVLITERGSTKIENGRTIYVGDHIGTSINGTIMLNTTAGTVTLNRKGEVVVLSDSLFDLKSGVVSLDRGSLDTGSSIGVKVSDYTFYLEHGCALIERKSRSLQVSKCVGAGSLVHESFGTVLFGGDSGLELSVDFGKAAGEPKARQILLPGWCADARSRTVMSSIGSALAAREYPQRERSGSTGLDANLAKRVEALMAYAVTTDSAVTFLTNMIENRKLDGPALLRAINDVVTAINEVKELAHDAITLHGATAAFSAESHKHWYELFYNLMRPPVAQGDGTRPAGTTTDCPNAKPRLKRVDNLPRKPVRRTPTGGAADTPGTGDTTGPMGKD